jgi:hypothetical protein
MGYRNDYCPVWEPITPSATVAQNYYGAMCLTAGNFVWHSEATGTEMTMAMTAGQTIVGRIVLVNTTSTGTYAGAKAT